MSPQATVPYHAYLRYHSTVSTWTLKSPESRAFGAPASCSLACFAGTSDLRDAKYLPFLFTASGIKSQSSGTEISTSSICPARPSSAGPLWMWVASPSVMLVVRSFARLCYSLSENPYHPVREPTPSWEGSEAKKNNHSLIVLPTFS